MHDRSLQQSTQPRPQESSFALEARKRRTGTAAQLVTFIRENKKWWLTPIIVALLLLGVLIVLGGTAAAPFIYTVF